MKFDRWEKLIALGILLVVAYLIYVFIFKAK